MLYKHEELVWTFYISLCSFIVWSIKFVYVFKNLALLALFDYGPYNCTTIEWESEL